MLLIRENKEWLIFDRTVPEPEIVTHNFPTSSNNHLRIFTVNAFDKLQLLLARWNGVKFVMIHHGRRAKNDAATRYA